MKNERGAISVFALLAMLFFLVFIMAAYNNVSTKTQTQIETNKVLVKTYKPYTDAVSLYNQMMAGEINKDVIKTEAQESVLDKKDYYIAIDGKIYNIK